MNKHVSKFMSAYVHGELDSMTRRQVEDHLRTCASCQIELRQIRTGADLASTLATEVPLSDISIRFNDRPLAAEFGMRKYVWASVAFVLLAITLFGLSSLWKRNDFKPAPKQIAWQPATPESPAVKASPEVELQISSSPEQRKTVSIPEPRSSKGWELTTIAGAPTVASRVVQKVAKLEKGEWLETDANSRAKLAVASIGFVDIGPNSRLRLVESSEREHRISLAKGKISAFILAPPRVFLVDTPSATAVDLGCAYTLDVDDQGTSTLRVTSGWVSFVLNGRESFVPAGASCITKSKLGVGTPVFDDASPAFQRKLAQIDFGKATEADIRELLIEARQKDSLTLWHLLAQGPDLRTRSQIFDFLEKSVPPPNGVTRDGILNSNKQMLSLWWEQGIRQVN